MITVTESRLAPSALTLFSTKYKNIINHSFLFEKTAVPLNDFQVSESPSVAFRRTVRPQLAWRLRDTSLRNLYEEMPGDEWQVYLCWQVILTRGRRTPPSVSRQRRADSLLLSVNVNVSTGTLCSALFIRPNLCALIFSSPHGNQRKCDINLALGGPDFQNPDPVLSVVVAASLLKLLLGHLLRKIALFKGSFRWISRISTE